LGVFAPAFLHPVHEYVRLLVGKSAKLDVGGVDVRAVLAHHEVIWLAVRRGDFGGDGLELWHLLCALGSFGDHKPIREFWL